MSRFASISHLHLFHSGLLSSYSYIADLFTDLFLTYDTQPILNFHATQSQEPENFGEPQQSLRGVPAFPCHLLVIYQQYGKVGIPNLRLQDCLSRPHTT